MLNRRLLRARVMQMLYAYRQAQSADYQFAQDSITKTFQDQAFLEGRDQVNVDAHVAASSKIYQKLNPNEGKSIFSSLPAPSLLNSNGAYNENQAKIVAENALKLYQNQISKDKNHLSRALTAELDQMYGYYLLALALLIQISDFVLIDEQEKMLLHLPPPPAAFHTLKLHKNPIIEFLRSNKLLAEAFARYNIDAAHTSETVRHFYRENFKKDPVYLDYQALEDITDAQHLEFARFLLKKQVLMHSRFEQYFEEKSLDWEANLIIVRQMADKSLKNAAKDINELSPISADWLEDKEFVNMLFERTLVLQPICDELLNTHLKNWEIERLLLTDRVIMQMAICEFLHFPNIPVKVSINEYLEIAKIYGSLQSQQFINGLLDKIAEQLRNEGKIKKSGRGLMDNK